LNCLCPIQRALCALRSYIHVGTSQERRLNHEEEEEEEEEEDDEGIYNYLPKALQ